MNELTPVTVGHGSQGAASGAAAQHSLPYNPALDGLRGIAIALVIPVHLHALAGGTFGVDIFFVLSGFLISEVIRNSVATPGYFSVFYFRRFLRLFPALAVTCAVVTLAFAVFSDGHKVYDDVLASLLYVQSWTSAAGNGFAIYLGHTWSLSVEEQFYLFWPAVFWLIARRWSNDAAVLGVAVAIAVVGYVWAFHVEAHATYDRAYFAADTRFEAIMIGAAGSAWRHTSLFRWRAVQVLLRGSGLALVAILAISAFLTWDELRSLIVALLSCLVILSAAERLDGIDGRVLRWGPLVWVGQISYSLYLWHVPVIAILFLNLGFHTGLATLIGLPVSVLLASGSYYGIERPLIRLRLRIRRTRQMALGKAALATSILSIAAGLLFFNWSDLAEWLHPQPLVVLSHGPEMFRMGNKAVLQPDGSLAVWVQLNRRPDMQSHATFDGGPATSFTFRDSIVVIVPPDLVKTPGPHSYEIFSSDGTAETPPFQIQILP